MSEGRSGPFARRFDQTSGRPDASPQDSRWARQASDRHPNRTLPWLPLGPRPPSDRSCQESWSPPSESNAFCAAVGCQSSPCMQLSCGRAITQPFQYLGRWWRSSERTAKEFHHHLRAGPVFEQRPRRSSRKIRVRPGQPPLSTRSDDLHCGGLNRAAPPLKRMEKHRSSPTAETTTPGRRRFLIVATSRLLHPRVVSTRHSRGEFNYP